MEINKIILAIIVFLNLLLSLFVFGQDRKSLNNRFFSLLSFLAFLWALTNYMTGVIPTPFWLESTYALGALLVAVGLIWTQVVTTYLFNRRKSVFIILVALTFSISSYVPGFLAKKYEHIYLGGIFTGEPGWGLFIYTIFYLLGAFLILWDLFITRRKTVDLERKIQLESIFVGALTTLTITAITSFILPSFSIFSFGGLDSVGFIIFLFFIAYAITKHHLFNIKVIATELIICILWIFILIRTFLADNTREIIVEGGLLLVAIIVGILLIRSVIKEVDQREKIEKLAKDLQKANDRLKEVDKQKSEFVSFATHQLRAPLTAMKGYASLILEKEMEPVSDKAREAIGRIFESANTLTAIVDDYLNVTRIELGSIKYTFDTINLKDLVENVIAELKPNIDKANKIHFSVDIEKGSDYRINADKDKLKQVIANLIDNSVKYTPKGKVVVSLSYDTLAHLYVFKVSDTGIGISPEILPKLFQKWSRSDNANKTNIKGTGLGLYVAKEIINAHHGTIRAESRGEGKGSVFIVELKPLTKV